MSNEVSTTEVIDRKSFIKFLSSLRNGFENNTGTWENTTLSDFLEALEAYADDVQGYYDNIHRGINADIPTWRVFADILEGASMYE
ncbi:MAG: hypothetical protein JWR38_2640 [Mucilaginibacter sp.]|nr:hypothetical protein [Mucilaginibacter sp.]